VNAIPTTYKGTNFRSRLEARWASTFDHIGLSWEYEPLDLRGWVPDFAVWREDQTPRIVEVKPAMCLEELRPHARRYARIAPETDFVLVGACPRLTDAGFWVGMWRDGDVAYLTAGGFVRELEARVPPAARAKLWAAWEVSRNTTQWKPRKGGRR
jgi:hypothetical protein